jgi:hypothetical protein
MQNLALGLFEVPHDGHRDVSGAAHLSQNFAKSGFSVPHPEHRIESPDASELVLFLALSARKGQLAKSGASDSRRQSRSLSCLVLAPNGRRH